MPPGSPLLALLLVPLLAGFASVQLAELGEVDLRTGAGLLVVGGGDQAQEPQITAGRRVRIDRKRARPYDGHGRHRLGSLLTVGAYGRSRPRECAASGCDDRHHVDLLPRADGTLRSSPSSQRSAVQKQEETSKCRRR
jgi:hypothetical protein